MCGKPVLSAIKKRDSESNSNGISFRTGFRDEQLIITLSPIELMMQHRQLKSDSPEAGGMLFARIEREKVTVTTVTTPQKRDKRGRFFFWPSLSRQQALIDREFANGNHFVGEWHTHPQAVPEPSNLDLESMATCFIDSKHQLRNLVLIIVGTDDSCESLWVSLHNAKGFDKLSGGNQDESQTES